MTTTGLEGHDQEGRGGGQEGHGGGQEGHGRGKPCHYYTTALPADGFVYGSGRACPCHARPRHIEIYLPKMAKSRHSFYTKSLLLVGRK